MGTPHPHTTLAVAVHANEHVLGPQHAPVTLVEYGDFECPSCKVAAPFIRLMHERYPQHLRIVFRHYPLEIPHPHALLAAEAAETAGAQQKFWQMHDELFAHQQHLELRDLERYAGALQLDLSRFRHELNEHFYLQKVREHIESGRRSHLRATPTFFLDDTLQDVSFGMQSLHDAVEVAVRTVQ